MKKAAAPFLVAAALLSFASACGALQEIANLHQPAVRHSNIRGLLKNTANIANGIHHRTLACDPTVPPVIICPHPVKAVTSSPTACSATISASPSVSDCGSITVTTTPDVSSPGGAILPVGTTTVTATAEDSDGNKASCTFTVEVTDTIAPTVTCPPEQNLMAEHGKCSNNKDMAKLVSFDDNCLAVLPAGSKSINQPRPAFPLGDTTVTARITDTNSQSAQCDFRVRVEDDQPPVLSACPANIIETTTSGMCSAPITFKVPSVTDNCEAVDGPPTLQVSSSPGSLFPIGTTTVTIDAEDGAGLKDSCNFTVTVSDNEQPIITCPNDILVETTKPAVPVTFEDPTVTDNCGDSNVNVTVSATSGTTYTIGTNTTITATAVDGSGNTAKCQFIVAIKDLRDTTPPVLSACPADITKKTEPGKCGAPVTFRVPTATDDFGTPVITVSSPSGNIFPIGTTTVTITAEDGAGLTDSCTFDVTVLDRETPIIKCPNDIRVETTEPTAFITFGDPDVEDNCGDKNVDVTVSATSGTTYTTGTNTTITATAEDGSGNTAKCQFVVDIIDLRDTTPPVLSACPLNIAKNTEPGMCGAPVTFEVPSATDDFGTAVITVSSPSGNIFPIGTTTVTITAEDRAGNTDSCSFTVTVSDNELPIINCPNDIRVETTKPNVPVTFGDPIVADNCGDKNVDVTVSVTSGTTFTTDTSTTITATAEDGSGNSARCQFIVDIIDLRDTTPPVLSACPANIATNTEPGMCGAPVTFEVPSATDDFGTPVITVSSPSGNIFPIGTTTVTITAEDRAGNTDSCTFTVTVSDNEPPIINCPNDVLVEAINPTVSVTFGDPTVMDNCGNNNVAVTVSANSGKEFGIGTNTTITAKAVDRAGNSADCQFIAAIVDSRPPDPNSIWGWLTGLWDWLTDLLFSLISLFLP